MTGEQVQITIGWLIRTANALTTKHSKQRPSGVEVSYRDECEEGGHIVKITWFDGIECKGVAVIIPYTEMDLSPFPLETLIEKRLEHAFNTSNFNKG